MHLHCIFVYPPLCRRRYLQSRPPGRQTVVTDLLVLATLLSNLNVSLTSVVGGLRLLLPALPCTLVNHVVACI